MWQCWVVQTAPLVLATLECSPTLGAGLKPLTRRVKPQSGTGTAANPYVVVVPVTLRSEWTVQALTGSNVNGASDADDWLTAVATGVRRAAKPAFAACKVGCGGNRKALTFMEPDAC